MVSPSTPKPRSVRMRRISSATMSVPSRALIFSGRRGQLSGMGNKVEDINGAVHHFTGPQQLHQLAGPVDRRGGC